MSNSGADHFSTALSEARVPERFNCPFCYTPHPMIVAESKKLMARISSSSSLRSLFSEGKMMGILMVSRPSDGSVLFLHGFSGLAGGRGCIEGFVPPIFDTSQADINSTSREQSQDLQHWLFSQYIVQNALGESRSILDIFAEKNLVPPGGTGDCAAPKLLNYAYSLGLKPLAIGEFWYGKTPVREVRREGSFYPSCTGKCGPLLDYMLRGLEVEPNPLEADNLWNLDKPVVRYEDRDIIVVEKPSGMLAVPGRNSRISLQQWLSELCGCNATACHRLDMDTSGLMVFAKNSEALASLQRQFEEHKVQKRYMALLSPTDCGITLKTGDSGRISLPLAPDYYDRPRQMVDFVHGRMSVTQYTVLKNFDDGCTLVQFTPFTGRTHQLRVHAAHSLGLGRPIAGDRLYGGNSFPLSSETAAGFPSPSGQESSTNTVADSPRLMLHASYLAFRHPFTFSRMVFESPSL